MRTILLAMPGSAGVAALAALPTAGAELVAVALPAPPGAPPLAALPHTTAPPHLIALGESPAPASLNTLAAEHAVPLLALRHMAHPAVAAALAALQPDLIVVACWPWRLPPALLALPRLGCLNLHPSALPELRGPEPIFWAFQRGLAQTAVSLHWMEAEFDTGPLALQAPLLLPIGMNWAEAEHGAARLGAQLLTSALPALAAGSLPRQPQRGTASYAPRPGPDDFRIEPHWPAERAFRFMRGTAAWQQPYPFSIGTTTLQLRTALAYSADACLGQSHQLNAATVDIQMTPGVLTATLVTE
jgi:methionyl-tRNA formyltransferase